MPLIREFYRYSKHRLGFSKKANIKLIHDESNSKDLFGKTGNYDPTTMTISIYITNRHPIDLLRSISHELVHHWQNCNGRFENVDTVDENYAQNNSYLRRLEKEAYERGNLIYRDYQDLKRGQEKKMGKTLQEAYYKRSTLVGQRFLRETIGPPVEPVTSLSPEGGDYEQEIVQGIEEKLMNGISKEDVIMSTMLRNHVSRQEALKYVQQAITDMQSSEDVNLEESLDDEYEIGDKEEFEHTDSPQRAHKIAKQHLEGDPNLKKNEKGNPKYYSKLKSCGLTEK